MKIKPIIFGSTGMIGQAVLLECLHSSEVESVLLINRRPGQTRHEKIREIVHADFMDFSSLERTFSGYDTCFFCLGVSAVGLTEEAYTETTYNLTIRVAKALLNTQKDFTFCYISGAGTDSTEKGKMMWARVKGKVENALLAMPFKQAYMFRPGYIQPLQGIRSKTRLYQVIYTIFKPLYFILRPFKGMVTDTGAMGRAMINVACKGYPERILENRDINTVASGL